MPVIARYYSVSQLLNVDFERFPTSLVSAWSVVRQDQSTDWQEVVRIADGSTLSSRLHDLFEVSLAYQNVIKRLTVL